MAGDMLAGGGSDQKIKSWRVVLCQEGIWQKCICLNLGGFEGGDLPSVLEGRMWSSLLYGLVVSFYIDRLRLPLCRRAYRATISTGVETTSTTL